MKQVIILIALILMSQSKAQNSRGSIGLGEGSYIQGTDRFAPKDNFKSLSLNASIEQALRKNFDEKSRKFQSEILDLQWEDTKDDFWMPKIQLTLNSGEHRVGRLRRGSKTANGADRLPGGSLALSLGEYTLFNWGKDYLAYLNNKETYRRSADTLKEDRRDLKHDIVIKYFQLYYFNRVVSIRKTQLRHASFVYRLNREKVTQKKVSRQEYYQSRSLYLKAQNEYHQSKNDLKMANEQMAHLLEDPSGTQYILTDELNYKKVKITKYEALDLAKNNNPGILDAQANVEKAKREYEITVKNNLPLPKFSVNLGAYTRTFGEATNSTTYTTRSGNSDVDIVASVNATWAITGSGGLFNQRTTDQSHINKQLYFNKLAQSRHQNESNVELHLKNLKHFENQITIFEARNTTLQKTFDVVLENYLNKKTRYLDFENTLEDMISADVNYELFRYYHVQEKVNLAREIGIEDYPGENFESLGQSTVGDN
ncbi:MAG: TolC family protein [Oligoflexia bacterium]|nr:TolC family protein [Oligoflexia bacterium]